MRGEETGDVDLTPPRLPDEAQRQAAIAAGAGLPSPGLGRLAIVHAGADTAHAGIHAIESFWDRIGPESPAGEFVIAVDEDVRLDDLEGTFFRWLANADPARDRIQRGPRIGFDARRKTPGRDDRGGVPVRDYPPLVSMSLEIVDRVDARWSDYGFKGDPAPSRFAPQDR